MKALRRKRLFIVLACLLFVVVVISGASAFFYWVAQRMIDFGKIAQPAVSIIQQDNLQTYLGKALPKDASDFHGMAYTFMQSRIIALSFQLPPTSTTHFLKLLGFQNTLTADLNPLPMNQLPEIKKFAWWNPDAASSFSGGSWTKPETFYDVLVNTTDSERHIIYLMVEQG